MLDSTTLFTPKASCTRLPYDQGCRGCHRRGRTVSASPPSSLCIVTMTSTGQLLLLVDWHPCCWLYHSRPCLNHLCPFLRLLFRIVVLARGAVFRVAPPQLTSFPWACPRFLCSCWSLCC